MEYERRILDFVRQNDTVKAFYVFDELLNGDFYPYPTYFTNVRRFYRPVVTALTHTFLFQITGSSNYFNLLSPVYPPNPFGDFLNLPSTQQALHVGSVKYSSYNSTVEKYLIPDWMRSMAPILPTLFDNYKVCTTSQLESQIEADLVSSGSHLQR